MRFLDFWLLNYPIKNPEAFWRLLHPMKILNSLIACLAFTIATPMANAADFYVVVPVKNRTAALSLTLEAKELRIGEVGVDYRAVAFEEFLKVAGGPLVDARQLSWTIASGAVPNGMWFDPVAGVLGGVPTEEGDAEFTVRVTYKGATAQQRYVVSVGNPVHITFLELPAHPIPGAPYSFNLKSLVQVTGADDYSPNQLKLDVLGLQPGGTYDINSGLLTGQHWPAGTFTVWLLASYGEAEGDHAYRFSAPYLTSCAELHQAWPELPNGNYILDLDGTGPSVPMSYYCDMGAAGGG